MEGKLLTYLLYLLMVVVRGLMRFIALWREVRRQCLVCVMPPPLSNPVYIVGIFN